MSKHKRVGDKKERVGKAGSPPSGTKNEKAREGKKDKGRLPKVSKSNVGGESGGGDEGGGGGALH